MLKKLSIAAMLAVITCSASADDRATLKNYFANLKTYAASFQQTTFDSDGKPAKTSVGTMRLQRPNRFIWRYETPFPQLIVSDGVNVWYHDIELEQVTVRPISEAMNGTPAALISGVEFEDAFEIVKDKAVPDGWIKLIPKSEESDFTYILLQLINGEMAGMQLKDQFEQTTRIVFTDRQLNPDIASERFRFAIPAGVELVGQPQPVDLPAFDEE